MATLLIVVASLSQASPQVIYDTGEISIGTTGRLGGSSVSTTQYLGVRFLASDDYTELEIGGHFGGRSGASIFGALVELTSPGDLPNLADLETSPGLVAAATIELPLPSAIVWSRIPGSVRGGVWYALVFGSGLFGASGEGFAPYEGVTANTFADSFWFNASLIRPYEVQSTLGYFGLRSSAQVVPEPSGILLVLTCLPLLLLRRYSK